MLQDDFVVVQLLRVVNNANSPNDLSVNLTHGDLMDSVPQQKGRSCPVVPSSVLAESSRSMTQIPAFRSLTKPQSPPSRMSVIVIGDISHVVVDIRLVVEH